MKDGIYLDLPFEEYIGAEERRGSTDAATLYSRREGWWWKSRHNPMKGPPDTSKALTFGSALHTLLLEGRDAFDGRFAVKPNINNYPGALRTIADIRGRLDAEGVKYNPKTLKSDLVQLALAYLPDVPIWDDILERFERTLRGREAITPAESFAVETMYKAALEDPDMNAVCAASGGLRLTEVSVFWTSPEGIPLRYRFDSLLPSWNADLKSIGNIRSRELSFAIGDRIAGDHLDVQLAMSFEARRAMYAMLEAGGNLHGGTKEARKHLSAFPKRAPLNLGHGRPPGWGWLWMFYQKPDENAGDAPVIFPVRVFFGDERHRIGFRKFRTALEFYAGAVKKFGLDNPWHRVDPIHDVNHTGENRVQFPPWEKLPEPVAGEEEALTWQE